VATGIDHGRKIPAAETTWMAAIGPSVAPLGVRRSITVTTSQLAATIAAVLRRRFLRAQCRTRARPLPLKDR
jgi:hypothetical protein